MFENFYAKINFPINFFKEKNAETLYSYKMSNSSWTINKYILYTRAVLLKNNFTHAVKKRKLKKDSFFRNQHSFAYKIGETLTHFTMERKRSLFSVNCFCFYLQMSK